MLTLWIYKVFASSTVPARAPQEGSSDICKPVPAPSEVTKVKSYAYTANKVFPAQSKGFKQIKPAVKKITYSERSIMEP